MKKRRVGFVLCAVVLTVCLMGSSYIWSNEKNTGTSGVQSTAAQWAEAVKKRDGKTQYSLLSRRCQKEKYAQYNENHWTTGTSSPWVESCKVAVNGMNASVDYRYATSEGYAGTYRQTLEFVREDGEYRIDRFSALSGSASSDGSEAGSDADFSPKIQASDYSVSIPDTWKAVQSASGYYTFLVGGKQVGTVEVLNYYPSEPFCQFYPNHSEEISTKQLSGLCCPVTETVLRCTQPAAAGDSSGTEERHFYFIPKNGTKAYDLWFDSAMVDEKTALKIASGFQQS